MSNLDVPDFLSGVTPVGQGLIYDSGVTAVAAGGTLQSPLLYVGASPTIIVVSLPQSAVPITWQINWYASQAAGAQAILAETWFANAVVQHIAVKQVLMPFMSISATIPGATGGNLRQQVLFGPVGGSQLDTFSPVILANINTTVAGSSTSNQNLSPNMTGRGLLQGSSNSTNWVISAQSWNGTSWLDVARTGGTTTAYDAVEFPITMSSCRLLATNASVTAAAFDGTITSFP